MSLRANLALVAAVSVATLAPSAHADGKAWAAISARLPTSVFVIGGANLGKVRASKIYKSALPALLAEDGDSKDLMAKIKSLCKVDVLDAIDDAAIAMADDDHGVIAIALKGLDETRFDACLAKVASAKHKVTITTARTGDIVTYSASGERDKLYIAWLAKDVLAIAANPEDQTMLATFLGGKGPAADLAAAVTKAGTGNAVWGAMAKAIPVDGAGKMTAAYGSISLVSAKIALDAHLVMSSAADATTVAAMGRQELADVTKRVPKAMLPLVSAVAIATSGNEVTVTVAVPDTSTADLMKLFDKMF